MSQSSREYTVDLINFYKTCLSIGAVMITKTEPNMLSIYKSSNLPPSVYMKPIAMRLKISTKKRKYRRWVFPQLSSKNIMKLQKIMNSWDEYLVSLTSNGKHCKIKLLDHMGKVRHKTNIRMFSL